MVPGVLSFEDGEGYEDISNGGTGLRGGKVVGVASGSTGGGSQRKST